MNKTSIRCHSSTPKEDLIAFVMARLGKKIKLHYESNMYPYWGDDHIIEYLLDEEGTVQVLKTIETHYIHGIEESL